MGRESARFLRLVLAAFRAFRANRGALLAAAVAYYALLSIVPLLLLVVIVLSNLVDQAALLNTLGAQLELLLPGQSGPVIEEVESFVQHRAVIGWVLLATMVFFSSQAFAVLGNAVSVIFVHRTDRRPRHFFVSALLPYCYVAFLGVGLLVVSLATSGLQAMSGESVSAFGHSWSLATLSGTLLQMLGVAGEVVIVTSIYVVMPLGRVKLSHALIGGLSAALTWEVVRRAVVWYFAHLFHVGVLYGSLTTAIALLLSLHVAATVLLLGSQLVAEYEKAEAADEAPAGLLSA